MNEYFKVNEIWRKSNICPDYEVSNYTQVREASTGQIIEQELIDPHVRGYYRVTLMNGNKESVYKVDDLVEDAFPDADKSKQKYMYINGKPRTVHEGYCTDKRINPKYYDKAKVRSVYTGQIYDSIRDCSLDTDIPMTRIAMSMESNILTANIPKASRKKYEFPPFSNKYEQINYVPLSEQESNEDDT